MRRILALFTTLSLAGIADAIDAAGRDNHGEQLTVDLPDEQHLRNTGGRDGAGLCVFTSIDHAARYQDCQALIGFRDFMTKYPGGGWPEKVSQYIPKMAASKGHPTPEYVQHTGGDVEFLRLALRTGRYVCVTYDGRDGVFYRGSIAHMVNLVHLSDQWAVIHDNNYPRQFLWMTPDQFVSRWRGNGGGWAIALLNPPPPPIPFNRPQTQERALAREDAMNALVLMTLLSPTTAGQWGQGCPDGQCAPVRSDSTYHGWYDAGAGQIELYWRGERIGQLDPISGKWQTAGKSHPVDLVQVFGLKPSSTFAAAADKRRCLCADDACDCVNCPEDCPASKPGALAPGDDPFPGGVVREKIQRGNSYEHSGRVCSRSQAFQALTTANLNDDRSKPFLTIVGDESMRKQLLRDLDQSPALRGWKDKLHIHDYALDHWCVKQVGIAPGITFQRSPDAQGKAAVEWRFRSYAGDVALAEALRKTDPNYRSDADPDPTKPKTPTPAPEPVKPDDKDSPNVTKIPPGLLIVAVIGLLAVLGAWLYSRR